MPVRTKVTPFRDWLTSSFDEVTLIVEPADVLLDQSTTRGSNGQTMKAPCSTTGCATAVWSNRPNFDPGLIGPWRWGVVCVPPSRGQVKGRTSSLVRSLSVPFLMVAWMTTVDLPQGLVLTSWPSVAFNEIWRSSSSLSGRTGGVPREMPLARVAPKFGSEPRPSVKTAMRPGAARPPPERLAGNVKRVNAGGVAPYQYEPEGCRQSRHRVEARAMAERFVPGTSLTVRLDPPTPRAIRAVVFYDQHPRRDGQEHRVENPPVVAVYVHDQQIWVSSARPACLSISAIVAGSAGASITSTRPAATCAQSSPLGVRFNPYTGPTRLNKISCAVFFPVRRSDLYEKAVRCPYETEDPLKDAVLTVLRVLASLPSAQIASATVGGFVPPRRFHPAGVDEIDGAS